MYRTEQTLDTAAYMQDVAYLYTPEVLDNHPMQEDMAASFATLTL